MTSRREFTFTLLPARACSADDLRHGLHDARVRSLSPSGTCLTVPARVSGAQLLALAGVLAMVVGLLVYLTDRPAGHALLLPAAAIFSGAPLFGVLGGWLPSFVHPFAFSLLAAAARPVRASPAYAACIAWWVVNVAFEMAQARGIAASIARMVESAFGHTSITQPLTNYLLRGTFDVGDLVAATAGALAAAGVLTLVHHREKLHAQA